MFKQIQMLVRDLIECFWDAPVRSIACLALIIAFIATYQRSCDHAHDASSAAYRAEYLQTKYDLTSEMLLYTLAQTGRDYNRIVTEMTIKKHFPPIDAERLLADND